MIVVAGTIEFQDAASRDAAVEATKPHQAATRSDEPGCLAYVFAADPVVDTRIQVYELWESAELLEPHFQHENYFNMRQTLGQAGMTGADTAKYRIDAHDPVYGEDGIATARFWSVE